MSLPGLKTFRNDMGLLAIELHYSADPSKNPNSADPTEALSAARWLEEQRKQYPDPNDFAREFEINWYAGKGSRVFPQFTKEIHERRLEYNRRKVLYRAWDFGWTTPAVLFAQLDARDRLCVLKEMKGSRQTTRDFASEVIARSAAWFPNHVPGYTDFCDPAGQQVKSIESEKNERRDVDVLANLGVYPTYEWGWSRKDGRTLIHQLLSLRSDQTPGLYVDPEGCPLLTQAFLGRYVYPETLQGKIKDEPDDQTHPWADLMGALRYLVTGLAKKLNLSRLHDPAIRPTREPEYHGYGTVRR